NDPALSRADLRSHLCEEIRAVIARYEPRVRVLQARPCEDTQAPTDLRFRLLCEVRLGSDEEQVEFDLAFSGAAHIASVT
ncbi:GPW/gp25 family protein, partial [Cupriavidus basilensis]